MRFNDYGINQICEQVKAKWPYLRVANSVVLQEWDISTATFTRSFSVSAKEPNSRGVTFKSDGTEMYIIGSVADSVHQYTLSTAWNISTATFTRSFSVYAKETTPNSVTFKSDGTEMYIIGRDSGSVHQYTLSTAWNISTATFTRSFSVNAEEMNPYGVTFKHDGTEMYTIGYTSDSVQQYTLSTAWNISTATFTRSFSVYAKETNPHGVTFKSDGTEMYIIGYTSRSVHQYTLSTAWNISTATFTRSFSVSGKETSPTNVTFKPDGSEMYIIGYTSDSVHQYSLPSTIPQYDGSNFTNALITIPLTSASVTDNVITLEYRLSVLDVNGETVNMAGLAKELAGTAVESCEYFEDILKDDLTQYKFVYKVNLLR